MSKPKDVPLSRSSATIEGSYDVVVVGSGYGGAIAASRLARAGFRVALFERGREIRPGQYPDTLRSATKEFRIDTREGVLGAPLGMFDFRVNDDMHVLLGNGLGGTSLINANVCIRPDPRVLADPVWPKAFRDDVAHGLERGYSRAAAMLRPVPWDQSRVVLPKHAAHAASALGIAEQLERSLGKRPEFAAPPIHVTLDEPPGGLNHVGVAQSACTLCGDCVSGCNHRAKNTTLMNYLPDAHAHGAAIFTRIEVLWVRRAGANWAVHYRDLSTGHETMSGDPPFVIARRVVLGAGSLGSTGILLRSRERGLPLSARLGKGFTGNGDILGFAFDAKRPVFGIGYGWRRAKRSRPVGPCITSVIDARSGPDLEAGFVLEEGVIPGALGRAVALPLAAAAAARENRRIGIFRRMGFALRGLLNVVLGPWWGPLRGTQTFLAMSHDDGRGELVLEGERVRVHWPGVGTQRNAHAVNDAMRRAADAIGGAFVPNPVWSKLTNHDLVTVHPLGGCGMGEDASRGVVDERCRVFADVSGSAVHDGLYVVDGAVMPRSLGTNPLFTIAAVAERACEAIAAEDGRTIDTTSTTPGRPNPDSTATPTASFEFTERMQGRWRKGDDDAPIDTGDALLEPMEFTLTVRANDVAAFVEGERHEAELFGTVRIGGLGSGRFAVHRGRFALFSRDPERIGGRRMQYWLPLLGADGHEYFAYGEKLIANDEGFDAIADTTTLFVRIHDGVDEHAPLLGRALLRIALGDFVRQVTTMRVEGAPLGEALAWQSRFGALFLGSLLATHGGVFAPLARRDPRAPARVRRELRLPAPESASVRTGDGVAIELTRFRGKGSPVLLGHGLGVSSRIFSIDTIGENLAEHLAKAGHDVWLVDLRASVALPSAPVRASADVVARFDWPAAIDHVRRATGRDAIDVLGHCYGSSTLFMSLLAGTGGVRSVIASQIAAHVRTPLLQRLRCGLHLPDVLDALGFATLDADTHLHSSAFEKLFDQFLRLQWVPFDERCNDPVCHRITFLYALLYEHAQLDPATHDALHEMFGIANIDALRHLGAMVRARQLVDADGNDVYLPQRSRLGMPITFIHGSENACFLPESTAETMRWLAEEHDPALHRRHVIPGYGHIDCIFGKDAARDVFPLIAEHLRRVEGPR
ncbi:MAG: alpha/beta fold hydrolase [Planctomycetes bacterium]|nr:alpha/beta fold hydrolase [Planctomycetota bacterium]